jgi:hypothetical protein
MIVTDLDRTLGPIRPYPNIQRIYSVSAEKIKYSGQSVVIIRMCIYL